MKEVIGILVCNSQAVLDHKLRDGKLSDGNYCYWEMDRFPQRMLDIIFAVGTGVVSESAKAPSGYEEDESEFQFPETVEARLYFAVKGEVKGYFVPYAVGEQGEEYELRFYSESWHPIEPIKIKPSQGFRYFNHEGKE